MERLYPPFGQIPGLVFGDVELTTTTATTAVSVAGVFAGPDGITVTLRTATRDPSLRGVEFSFEGHDQPGGHLYIGLVSATQPGSEPIAANLIAGGRGEDDGLDARSYTLWFPVDVSNLDEDASLVLRWPEAKIDGLALPLRRDRLQDAAKRAKTLPML
jgi:hypothetical protein